MTSIQPVTVSQGRWPRILVIYYVLAGMAIATTAGSILFTRWMINSHDQTTVAATVVAREQSNAWRLMALTSDMQALAMQGTATRVAFRVEKDLAAKATEFRFVLSDLGQALREDLSGEVAANAARLLTAVGEDEKLFSGEAVQVLDAWAKGEGRDEQLAGLASRISVLQAKLGELTRLMAVHQREIDVSQTATVSGMRRNEAIASGIAALMVLLLSIYGRWAGLGLRRKLQEMVKTNRQLSEAHEQALAFAREIDATYHSVVSLNQQLAEKVKALREAQDEIMRKGRMASLGQLIATVAHELRNPLGAVRTSAYVLERRLREADVKGKGVDVDAQLHRINSGISRCDDTITQLLDFSRTRELVCEEVDLDQWLSQLVKEEAEQLPEQVVITCELGLSGRKVPIDPSRLQRAVHNIVSNASEAMVGKAGNPLKNPTPNPRITVATSIRGNTAEIAVSDNGPGMTADILARVREPMFTTKNFGTGLGIPAVEQIMSQHGGELEIASVPGAGARFTMILPLTQGTAQETSEAA